MPNVQIKSVHIPIRITKSINNVCPTLKITAIENIMKCAKTGAKLALMLLIFLQCAKLFTHKSVKKACVLAKSPFPRI